jgi:hypothetical protein
VPVLFQLQFPKEYMMYYLKVPSALKTFRKT